MFYCWLLVCICFLFVNNVFGLTTDVTSEQQLLLNQALLNNKIDDICITRYGDYNSSTYEMPPNVTAKSHAFTYYGCHHPLCKNRQNRHINPMTICKVSTIFFSKVEEVNKVLTLVKLSETGNELPEIELYQPVKLDNRLRNKLSTLIDEIPAIQWFTTNEILSASYHEFKYEDGKHYADSYDTFVTGCGPSTLPPPGAPIVIDQVTCGQYRVITFESVFPTKGYIYFEYLGSA